MSEIINVEISDSQETIAVTIEDQQEMINIGLTPVGDMRKAIYDTDNNGQVDKADDSDLFGGFTLAFLQAYLLARSNHTGEQDIDSTTTGALPLGRITPIAPLTILGNNFGGFGSTPVAMTVTELLTMIGAFTFDGSDVEFTNNITSNRSYSTYTYATNTVFSKKFAPYGGGALDHFISYLRHADSYYTWEDDSENEIMKLEQSDGLTIQNKVTIGTPTDNLEITPAAASTQLKTNGGYLAIKNGQNAFYGLVVRSFGSNSYFANVNAESGFALFSYNNSGSTNALKIDSDGDVYVNDTNLRYSNIIIEGGSTRTLSETDSGKTIRYTSLSGCTVTIPDTLLEGFTCLHIQKGSVQVTFATSGSMTMVNADGHTKTAKLHAVACTLVEATNIVNLNGYTA